MKRVIPLLTIWLTAILIFLVPCNLFMKFGENQAYVKGLLIDYLLPKFYLSDLPALGLIGIYLFQVCKKPTSLLAVCKENKTLVVLLGIFIGLLGIRQIFSPYPLASLWMFFKLVEMGLLALALSSFKAVWKSPIIFWSLVATLVFQSGVGLYQFVTQSAVGGYLFLGEASFETATQLAKTSWFGVEKILPYGTTAHPNVLGGVLVVSLLMAWKWYRQFSKNPIQLRALLSVTFIALPPIFLTFSLSSWLALGVGTLLLISPKKIINGLLKKSHLIILFSLMTSLGIIAVGAAYRPDNFSLFRRQNLNWAAIQTFTTNPWLGSGLNTSAAVLEPVIAQQEVVRFVQPVHHAGLLWLSETGVLGVNILITIWFLMRKFDSPSFSPLILALLPLAVFDHYLLTLQTGLLVLVLSLVITHRQTQAS